MAISVSGVAAMAWLEAAQLAAMQYGASAWQANLKRKL